MLDGGSRGRGVSSRVSPRRPGQLRCRHCELAVRERTSCCMDHRSQVCTKFVDSANAFGLYGPQRFHTAVLEWLSDLHAHVASACRPREHCAAYVWETEGLSEPFGLTRGVSRTAFARFWSLCFVAKESQSKPRLSPPMRKPTRTTPLGHRLGRVHDCNETSA